ncbi:MAG: hypothetical protein Tsb002_05300 [Wenzhouxiangellaceae bacterium]
MRKLIYPLFILALTACDIEQTEQGSLPEIDVEASAGNLPEYDIDWANIEIRTDTQMVEVPKLIVVMEEVEVDMPYIDIDMPGDASKEERSIIVEAEIEEQMRQLQIQKVYAKDKQLIVVSRLGPGGKALDQGKVRISDQLTLNAPDFDVRHIIIGEQPDGAFNRQYRYVATESRAQRLIEDAQLIYSHKQTRPTEA